MRVLVAAALCASSACHGGEPSGALVVQGDWPVAVDFPRGPEIRYERVVLVTIDTLRADHVSAYGYRRATTPFFDALAERGVLFTRANATVSHTAPSHASMLTGLPTLVHGVDHNGYELDPDAVDLARLFAAAGFDTAACVNERFLERVAHSFRTVHSSRGRGEEVVRLAQSWLGAERRGPRFFLWVHLFDPHRWKNLVLEIGSERPFHGRSDPDFLPYVMDMHGLTPEGVEALLAQHRESSDAPAKLDGMKQYQRFVDSYDTLVLYSDLQLQALYISIAALGLPGPTLWIVTADHGEGLGSHGLDTHGPHIYQEQLHVPLLFHASDVSLGPARIDALVSHLDLFPTLVEALGGSVRAPEGLVDGRSLWPFLRGELPDWSRRVVFAQRKPLGAPLFSVQDERYKLLDIEEGTDELYDLRSDPRELENRIESAIPERTALAGELGRRLQLFEAHAQGLDEQEIPEELLEELRELGYVR